MLGRCVAASVRRRTLLLGCVRIGPEAGTARYPGCGDNGFGGSSPELSSCSIATSGAAGLQEATA